MANRRGLRKDGGSKIGSKLLAITMLVAITLLQVQFVASTSRFHQHLPDVMHSDIESPPVVSPRFRVSASQRNPAHHRFLGQVCDRFGSCQNTGEPGPQNNFRVPPPPPA